MPDEEQKGTGAAAGEESKVAADLNAKTKSRRKALTVAGMIGVVLLIGAISFLAYASTYESTDDAQVGGHLVGITARVDGTTAKVYVDENQFVKAGQLVAEMDPRDSQVALEKAQAEYARALADSQAAHPSLPITQTTAQTNISTGQSDVLNAEAAQAAAERDLAGAQARVREAEANNTKAQSDVARYKMLVDKEEISREQFDQVVATAGALAAAVDSARASAEAAQKFVDERRALTAQARTLLAQANVNAPNEVAITRANVNSRQANAVAMKAAVDQAQLDLGYCKIFTPVSGVVSNRTVELGQHVDKGQRLFTVADLSDLYITANFKETQVRHMVPGQPVTISVDALGKKFDGYVEAMPGATGSVVSLLPPENATGNYVKVVQRLPVRIRFLTGQGGLGALRPGMSVVPTVWLRRPHVAASPSAQDRR